MQQEHLLKKVRAAFAKRMNGYVNTPNLDVYIQNPLLGNNAATIGCLAMAKEAKENDQDMILGN